MRIDAELMVENPGDAGDVASRVEQVGFDCLWINETKHDPFVQLPLAAMATKKVKVGTAIALAFTRSPTALAYTAWDIQRASSGRLILGLGSQVRGHIERRFGVRWEAPAAKMREVVMAVRAVWHSWQSGDPLLFEGKFFKLSLMTPFFSPGPIRYPTIPIYVAGVNRLMCRTAGEVADGVHIHPLHTVRYIRESVRPAVEAGARKSGRRLSDVELAASVFAATGSTREQISQAREAHRAQVAFYASTRTYRPLMEMHGWGDICDRLRDLSLNGEWRKMPGEVTDDMLSELVIEGRWEEVGLELRRRYAGLVDRVRLYRPFDADRGWEVLLAAFRGGR